MLAIIYCTLWRIFMYHAMFDGLGCTVWLWSKTRNPKKRSGVALKLMEGCHLDAIYKNYIQLHTTRYLWLKNWNLAEIYSVTKNLYRIVKFAKNLKSRKSRLAARVQGGWLGEAGHPGVAAQQFGLRAEYRGGAESLRGGHRQRGHGGIPPGVTDWQKWPRDY